MKRVIILVLVAAAAAYGWKTWKHRKHEDGHTVVVENAGAVTLLRVRLDAGAAVLASRDSVPPGAQFAADLPLQSRDTRFRLRWNEPGHDAEREWNGGQVVAGPIRMAHRLQFAPGGGVVWLADPLPAKTATPRR